MVVDVLDSVLTRLRADAAISLSLGGPRIYRKQLPPSIIYPSIVGSYVDDLDQDDSSTSNYGQARIQCTGYASTDQAAFKLSKLIKKSLHNLVNVTLNGSNILSIVDLGAVPDSNPDIPVYLYHRDFMVKYLDL